jgi:hypothetical protein
MKWKEVDVLKNSANNGKRKPRTEATTSKNKRWMNIFSFLDI